MPLRSTNLPAQRPTESQLPVSRITGEENRKDYAKAGITLQLCN